MVCGNTCIVASVRFPVIMRRRRETVKAKRREKRVIAGSQPRSVRLTTKAKTTDRPP